MPRPATLSEADAPPGLHDRETLPPPTVPEPRPSQMRLRVARGSARIDVVLADSSRDPRSEEHDPTRATAAPRRRTWPFRAREDHGWMG